MEHRRMVGWLAVGILMGRTMGAGASTPDETQPRGRWIFRYDRSGEQPPTGRAQPNYLGVITERTETRDGQWGLRMRVETLEGNRQTIDVTPATRVDGKPARQAAKTLTEDVVVAVFGREERGAFRAEAVFVVPSEDWSGIVADARRGADRQEPLPGPRAAWQWGAEAEEPAGAAFAWPQRAWKPRYPIPQVSGPTMRRRPASLSPMERVRRADFSGTVRGIRNGGRELSVVTPGAVVLVLLDDQTVVRRNGEAIAPGDLREGDVVDVAVATWRGAESCTAGQLWVVAARAWQPPITAP